VDHSVPLPCAQTPSLAERLKSSACLVASGSAKSVWPALRGLECVSPLLATNREPLRLPAGGPSTTSLSPIDSSSRSRVLLPRLQTQTKPTHAPLLPFPHAPGTQKSLFRWLGFFSGHVVPARPRLASIRSPAIASFRGVPPDPMEEKKAEPRRCGRHPSQLLTGICSSCLMERLSSVHDQPEAEIVEVGAAVGPAGAPNTRKLRTTLMLLFQLDDSCGGTGVAGPSEGLDPRLAAEIGADSGGGGDRGGRRKSGSWLRSILPRRGIRWRKNGASSVKAPSPPPLPRDDAVDPSGGGPSSRCFGNGNSEGRGADVQAERKVSFRRSSEWKVGGEPSKSSVEPPRHSWDGAMVGKAFASSFACLEDPPGTSNNARRSSAAETVAETHGGVAESRNGGRHSLDEVSDGWRIRGRGRGDAGLDMAISGVGRRRSNRWSRVWDWSITSPLKEFVRKGDHVLERSLSESRKDVRRSSNAEAAGISGEIQPGRSNGHVSGRASRGATRISQAASIGDVQNFRADWPKNKECKMGRSRSVHYTPPGNLDNGMLRFYLTPMRSSRTTNRGRGRNSRLFGRGLFGFI
jgi:hypothetical protein